MRKLIRTCRGTSLILCVNGTFREPKPWRGWKELHHSIVTLFRFVAPNRQQWSPASALRRLFVFSALENSEGSIFLKVEKYYLRFDCYFKKSLRRCRSDLNLELRALPVRNQLLRGRLPLRRQEQSQQPRDLHLPLPDHCRQR